MSPDPGVFQLALRTRILLVVVALATAAALAATWTGTWTRRFGGGDDDVHVTTRALPPSSLPRDDSGPAAARGDVVPDARDAVLVRDLEFLSWYARRRSAGAPTAVALPELPETLGDSESPEGADAQ